MSSKSILILGAGLMQKPAIESAKSLGLKVFVIDANPNAVCVPLADEFKQIDLKAREKIAEYAVELKQKENLVSIFTAGTDFSASVSYASEKTGLLSHSFEAALNASDKSRMRSCFKKENVPSPDFVTINKSQICESLTHDFVTSLQYPLVVKPVDNMGARGCRMIRNKSELLFSIEDAVRNSRSGNCILEDYMEGPEFSIDALIYDGTMTITGFADRHIYFPPYFIETGHTMPTAISGSQYNELIQTFARGAYALGLTRGAAKADIKYTKDGPMVGEIAARLSGGYMSGWTFPYSSDLNLTKAAIQIACGDAPSELESMRKSLEIDAPYKMYNVPSVKCSAERAWISIPGVVKKIYGLDSCGVAAGDSCIEGSEVRDILPRVKEGDKVVFPRNNVEKCGNVIAVAKTRDAAVLTAENFIKNITLELESGNKETQYFLDGKKLKHEDGFAPLAFELPLQVVSALKKELDEKKKKIPAGESVLNYIPSSLNKDEVLNIKDWNHLSLKETLKKFDLLKPEHKAIDYKKFWTYLIRGGIQGALYAEN
ncbi:ATP-grasp domain-containing protein [Treponema sp.]|uniref:ATP-grasp domain-containing protein n=1 Tax=Treponema sp. TaxID=166 RepID=UPI00298DAF26|nr:ATP-grasp domain-containing protein [Treponema sp.]MCR5612108.1 ATP-grasp domain-containing protein [Treponema sp.]